LVGSILNISKKEFKCPNCEEMVVPILFQTKTLNEVQGAFHRNARLMGCPNCHFAFWDYQK